VSGWAGGEVHLWTKGSDSAVAVVLAERPGQEGLCESVREWYRDSFEGDQETGLGTVTATFDGAGRDAIVACRQDEVRLGIAPEQRTAQGLFLRRQVRPPKESLDALTIVMKEER
jgi:hypothetical protein